MSSNTSQRSGKVKMWLQGLPYNREILWNTCNWTEDDSTHDLKNTAEEQRAKKMRCELFIFIPVLLKILYYCWHLEAKHSISFSKFTPYFPKLLLRYLFAGEEGRAGDSSPIASVKLPSHSHERRENLQVWKKKNQLSGQCMDKYKFRNEHSRRCFYICGEVKLQAQPYCSL